MWNNMKSSKRKQDSARRARGRKERSARAHHRAPDFDPRVGSRGRAP